MAERTRWRQKFDALSAEHELLRREYDENVDHAKQLGAKLEYAHAEIAELNKAVERARLQGMNEVTGLLLKAAE